MTTVLLRTIVIYLTLVLSLRLTGKRQIGEMQLSELVVTFMLSELAVFPITDKNVPLTHAILPIAVLLSSEVIFSFLQTKSPAFRKFLCGGPSVIIEKGRLRPDVLAKNRLDVEEMLGELRLKGCFDISQVEWAILEENGKMSVLTRADTSPFTPEQLNLPVDEHGCAHPVIVDGLVNANGLSSAGKTEAWLEKFLKKNGLSLPHVFLMTVDDLGDVSVYASSGDPKKNSLSLKKYSGGKS